jgi:hypothetical protein
MARLYLSASDTKDGKYQREIDEICKEIGFESEDKGARLRAVIDSYYEKLILNKNSPPTPTPQSDIKHLNIDQKDGAIRVWERKHDQRIEVAKFRMWEAYGIEKARQKAKTEGEADRAEIREEERLHKRIVSDRKPKIDWGDSEGIDPDYHDGYR